MKRPIRRPVRSTGPLFSFTRELFGYALRDGRGYTRAIIAQTRQGWHGQAFTVDIPYTATYATKEEAKRDLKELMLRHQLIPTNSIFGDFP